ncbi:hypothetical protein LSTR_LSTR001028 [Laodelphax striatellus]|uniref:Uncharacterized protein n=1 Tax=Laodelphax striatellus TaxID=195883 RepID=A0A482X0Y3_LAOST|nr:hypothetical protein LSTR_LSTR001028 [Laodelphax striatellus]
MIISRILVSEIVLVLEMVSCLTLEEKFIEISSRHKRQLTYPYGSAIGMYLAFVVPVDLQEQDILFSYNFEANYNLPTTLEQYAFQSLKSLRSFSRQMAFKYLESYLDRQRINGEQCILRLICEVSQAELRQNGLLGNLIHVLFTPSTTFHEPSLDAKFSLAEQHGTTRSNCTETYTECKHGLLDLISYEDE